MRTLVLGSIHVALFQSKNSYNFSKKSPETVNPDNIINSSPMPTAFRLKILHTLVHGSIHVALFQSKSSYNFSLKSPVTVNPGGIINSSTMPITPAKNRSKEEL